MFFQLKAAVKKSFALVYSTLKARELKTLRQLDAIRKHCQSDKALQANCVQNIHISYDNESTLINNINNFGEIDFEKLNFDSSTFVVEDYVSPHSDHMYSYKCIEDLTLHDDLEAIEEAALKQITNTKDCVCYVNIRTEDVSRKFREVNIQSPVKSACDSSFNSMKDVNEYLDKSPEIITDSKSECSESEEVKKIDPTDEWLNSIKNQTETEPTQASDVMEHSTIACL